MESQCIKQLEKRLLYVLASKGSLSEMWWNMWKLGTFERVTGNSNPSKTRLKILQPSRITSNQKTHVTNIFPCFISHEITSGNITATVSDNLPQFLFVPKVLLNPSRQKLKFMKEKKIDQNLNKKVQY